MLSFVLSELLNFYDFEKLGMFHPEQISAGTGTQLFKTHKTGTRVIAHSAFFTFTFIYFSMIQYKVFKPYGHRNGHIIYTHSTSDCKIQFKSVD